MNAGSPKANVFPPIDASCWLTMAGLETADHQFREECAIVRISDIFAIEKLVHAVLGHACFSQCHPGEVIGPIHNQPIIRAGIHVRLLGIKSVFRHGYSPSEN